MSVAGEISTRGLAGLTCRCAETDGGGGGGAS